MIDDGSKLEEEIGVGSYLRKLHEYLKEKYLREKLESVSICYNFMLQNSLLPFVLC